MMTEKKRRKQRDKVKADAEEGIKEEKNRKRKN
jgi:hypothetical protein